jgi:hypothetical protein
MPDFSKTDELCDCDTLQNAANNPDLPIVFDAKLNEFHFVFNANGGEGFFNLYHCFFCGGKAPESKRHLLFATISEAESFRLRELTNSLKTLDDVLASLGKPDQDREDGIMIMLPETEDTPSKEQWYRSLIYENLSDVADIRVTVYPNERVGIGFMGKYIGDKEKL